MVFRPSFRCRSCPLSPSMPRVAEQASQKRYCSQRKHMHRGCRWIGAIDIRRTRFQSNAVCISHRRQSPPADRITVRIRLGSMYLNKQAYASSGRKFKMVYLKVFSWSRCEQSCSKNKLCIHSQYLGMLCGKMYKRFKSSCLILGERYFTITKSEL